jgi:pyruvate carboxylase subunit B
MAGFISPKDAFELTSALKKEVGLPVNLHSHCSSGMAPISYLFACQAGVDIIDTAISPFAWGTSQPPTESIVASLKNTPYDTNLDLELLSEICEYFRKVKQKYTISQISESVDPSVVIHQIPGGMLSNLISQLKEQNAMDKYYEVLKEVPIVRKELGYPPLVTPTSQIVGTQAVFNVLTGKRYKIVPKEVKDYVRGLYGRPPANIDDKIQKTVIGDEKIITCRPADLLKPEYDKCVNAIKKYSTSEDYILAYALFPQITIQFFEQKIPTEPEYSKKDVEIVRYGDKNLVVSIGDKKYDVVVTKLTPTGLSIPFKIVIDNKEYDVRILRVPSTETDKKSDIVRPTISGGVMVKAPMPGRVIDVKVAVGDTIKEGDLVVILESMKMQNEITSDVTGVIKEVTVRKGDTVEGGDVLVRIET